MENQHRKITGYRDLNQKEIDLMNEVKALGVGMEDTLKKVEVHIKAQRDSCLESSLTGNEKAVSDRMQNATPERFLALAKTEFQTGLMYATRAVAQPEFF
ncbi:MAG: hypothetical protein O6499_00170 [Candidatus Dadabacteria bacterium]|nr:hypothetical protein [Candidatus Dadabacteria bacterium]